jgi:hypothetical protein
MVKRLVEFPFEQGGSVLIEIDEPPATPVTRGLGKDYPALVEQADKAVALSGRCCERRLGRSAPCRKSVTS